MLDIQLIRDDPEGVRAAAESKGERGVDVDRILELDAKRRAISTEADDLKHQRNVGSKKIGAEARAGEDVAGLKAKMREIGERIKQLDGEISQVGAELDGLLLRVPNIPAEGVPEGPDASGNVEVRSWGEKPEFDFEPKAHWDLGPELGIIDFKKGAEIAGSFFSLYRGLGARLERALWNFMLDLHTTEHGFVEVFPPFLANRDAMTGTGQLPKLEADMYHVPTDDLFLIPTGEVPITNLHRGEIFQAQQLPVCYTGYTACFRREAGSYGRDTRGMVRVHQFNKVEMVKFVEPEKSADELESLVCCAETVLQRLGLHYRVIELCTGELSFAAAKCYDIEVWAPGVGQYLEVSSCSNFTDFQARRCNTRFRSAESRPRYVHTLNGSGVATPRAMIALLETYQREDGTVGVPEVLRSYLGGVEVIGR